MKEAQALAHIKKHTGIELEKVEIDEIWDDKNKNSYTIDQAENIIALNLRNNTLKEIAFLANLTSLEGLGFWGNQVADISFLANLTNLKILSFSENQIVDISAVANLTKLEKLWFYDNQVIDIYPLISLTNLKELYFYNNQVSDLAPVKELGNLTILYLSNNQISDISPVKELGNLRGLALSNNQISDISPVKELGNLTILVLGNNQISDISAVKELINLEWLLCDDNQISDISQIQAICQLPKLQYLDLQNNPLPLPIEFWNDGFANILALRDYLQSIENEQDRFYLHEARLILVGRGGVGKSELVEALAEPNYVFEEGRDSTEGIQIRPWQAQACKNDKNFDLQVNVWDFGGQEIYYGTHQYFLSKNALYILVWDARKEEDHRSFDYWLRSIGLYGQSSPVLVVQNKVNTHLKQIDQKTLQQNFPFIKGFYETDCSKHTDFDFPKLRKDLLHLMSNFRHIGEIWNKNRKNIRDILQARPENYISLTAYENICEENGLKPEEMPFLSKQLHDLGAILHFEDDIDLNEILILKPQWAIDAAYQVLTNTEIPKQKGKFGMADLRNIWKKNPSFWEKRTELIKLMKRFDLIFQFQETETYIAPDCCPAESPKGLPQPDAQIQQIRHEYHYEWMPKGILTRFICRNHNEIDGEFFWKDGVLLDYKGTKALVEADEMNSKIRLRIWGKEAKEVLYMVRKALELIHTNLKMFKVEGKTWFIEKVPCRCSECTGNSKGEFFEYLKLKNLLENKKIYEKQCPESGENLLIIGLLDGIIDLDSKKTLEPVLVEELIKMIEELKYSDFFETLDKKGISDPILNRIRQEFMLGKVDVDFWQRQKVYVRSLQKR